LADGQKGTLAPGSLAEGAQLILPLEIQRLEAQTMLQTAIALEPEWLIDLAGDEIQEERLTRYDPDQRAVRRVERLKWGNLILDDSERDEPEADLAASALAEAILDGLVELPGWDERVDQWIARVRCVAAWFPERGLPKYERPDLSAALTQALRASQASRAKHLKKLEALSAVKQAMSWEEQRFVEQMAPERYRLPSGHGMKIHYEPGAPPLGKAKIQDFYDQRHTPRVGGGRQAVLLEILGPNFRPVQRTDDLPGFWQRLYPELKKELKRRYPRHQWR
jgi:ATP-dependent helicase HrpB